MPRVVKFQNYFYCSCLDPAVSSHDGSDSHGISVVGVGENGKYYILDSFEKE